MAWNIRAFYLNPDELDRQNPGFSTLLKDQGRLMTRGVLALAPCLNFRGSSSPIALARGCVTGRVTGSEGYELA
jgi:hypothetical protein